MTRSDDRRFANQGRPPALPSDDHPTFSFRRWVTGEFVGPSDHPGHLLLDKLTSDLAALGLRIETADVEDKRRRRKLTDMRKEASDYLSVVVDRPGSTPEDVAKIVFEGDYSAATAHALTQRSKNVLDRLVRDGTIRKYFADGWRYEIPTPLASPSSPFERKMAEKLRRLVDPSSKDPLAWTRFVHIVQEVQAEAQKPL